LHPERGSLYDGQAERVKVAGTGESISWTQEKAVFMIARYILRTKKDEEGNRMRACVQRKQSLDWIVRTFCGIWRRMACVVRWYRKKRFDLAK